MKKLLLLSLVMFCLNGFSQDHLKKASENLDRGNRKGAIDMATKALEQNPNNNDALFIRAKGLLIGNTSEEQFGQAITDLNLMITNGVKTGEVYQMLGQAENEFAEYIYRWKKDSENKTNQTGYYKEAVLHYENSIKAYQKAMEIDPTTTASLKFKVKDAEGYIQEIRQKIN